MIPQTIHYCWFGRNPKPALNQKCIDSWRKHCPNYEIIEWNESNYDISSAPVYVRQAYELKKWAFVTDYVRLQVIYENGGIYLDTDVEIIKKIDDFLQYRAFFGFESNQFIGTGLGFGAEKGHPILQQLMNDYLDIPFVKDDGTLDLTPCPKRNAHVFEKSGAVLDGSTQITDTFALFSAEYFCPLDWKTKKMAKTKNTVTIHWFSASWWDAQERSRQEKQRKALRKDRLLHLPNRALIRMLGTEKYEKLKKVLKRGK